METVTKYKERELTITHQFSEYEMIVIRFLINNGYIFFGYQDDEDMARYPSEISYYDCKGVCNELENGNIITHFEARKNEVWGMQYFLTLSNGYFSE